MRMLIWTGMLFATAALAAPKIEMVGPDTVDFGKYDAWQKKVAQYVLRNGGDEPLKIVKIRKTCGCASATADKQILAPGETTTVEVVILPDSIYGLFSKNTFIESNDPVNRFFKLTVAGNAIPLVDVKPSRSLYAGRIKTGSDWSGSFQLIPSRTNLVFGKAEIESNFKITTTVSPTNNPGPCTVTVRFSPTQESGDWRCGIKVPILEPTNHPPVSLEVVGRAGYQLNAVPGIFYIPVSSEPVTRTVTLWVLGQRSRVLEPDELELPKAEGASFTVEAAERGRLSVKGTFSPEFTRQLHADESLPLVFTVPRAASGTVVCRSKN